MESFTFLTGDIKYVGGMQWGISLRDSLWDIKTTAVALRREIDCYHAKKPQTTQTQQHSPHSSFRLLLLTSLLQLIFLF